MSILPRPPLATLRTLLGVRRSGGDASASPRFVLATPGGKDDTEMSLDRLESSEVSHEVSRKLSICLRGVAAAL
jgi:hypothetical protein